MFDFANFTPRDFCLPERNAPLPFSTQRTEQDERLNELPLDGDRDNVRCFEAIKKAQKIAHRTSRIYTGPKTATFAPPGEGSIPFDKELRKLILNKRKKRDEYIANQKQKQKQKAKQVSGSVEEDEDDESEYKQQPEAAREDDELDGESVNAERPLKKTRIALEREQVEALRQMLLKGRSIIEDGISNIKYRHQSSPYALKEDELVEGVETTILGGESEPRRQMGHQRDAVGRWEHNMETYKSCMLADDMGLGKTMVIVAVIVRQQAKLRKMGRRGLFMIVVPKSLIRSWSDELRRAPKLKYKVVQGQNDSLEELQSYDVLLTTYGALVQSYRNLHKVRLSWLAAQEGYDDELQQLFQEEYERRRRAARNPDRVAPPETVLYERAHVPLLHVQVEQLIIDEAHNIKNPDTHLSQAMRLIKSRCRGSLTGTPLQNHIKDFGSLLQYHCIAPFDDPVVFKSCFMTEKNSAPSRNTSQTRKHCLNDAMLSSIRAAFAIRRVKNHQFDGEPMMGIPDWSERWSMVEPSPDAVEAQAESRCFWDEKYRLKLYKTRDEDDAADEEIKTARSDALTIILRARLSAIHLSLVNARYSEYGVEDIDKFEAGMAAGYVLENDNTFNTAAVASEHLQRIRRDELSNDLLKKINKRRKDFLGFFRRTPGSWRSDKLYWTAVRVHELVQQRIAEAYQLPWHEQNEHLSQHKVLVFCEYLSALGLLEVGLREEFGISVDRYDGTLNPDQRNQAVKRFGENGKEFNDPRTRSSDLRVLALTTRAGAEGITLVHASDVIILASSWNPFIEEQIIARVVRKRNEDEVAVHRFILESSYEEAILRTQKMKRYQTARVLDDDFVETHSARLMNMSDEDYLETAGIDRIRSAAERGKIPM
ncbi:hypothetical protein D0868_08817 [Hortaea werneckii]|uniref:Helicase ATP-binding domain-containing protein n=1 Tax=Hortaea werneckii TaxID=91943 RepID=A0A3M6YDE5_HORWE|nr:hypothetical protein D0868_08817 [Hortaea werneckii]